MNDIWTAHILNDMDRYYRLAFCYVKDPQDTKDIIQDSLYKALKTRQKLKNTDAVRTWFYRIVVNTSIDFLRKRKTHAYLDEAQWEAIPDMTEETHPDLKEEVERLPIQYRTIIILRYYEDLKIHDIAQILDENENTVKSRLYAALKKLRIELEYKEEVF